MSKNVVVEEIEDETPVEKVEPVVEQSPIVEEEKPNYLWIIIPTALLVGALVGGLITYFSGISKLSNSNVSPSPVSSSTPEASPSATPLASIKRSDIKIQVLNGSGKSGLAGKVKTYLEGLGYKDVAVGNASSSSFVETEIQIKDSKKDFLETITDDLSENYTVSKETKTLVISSKYDIVVTIGSK